MERRSLGKVVSDDLLGRIVAGEFPPDALLPNEPELVARHGVSRMTVREAVKTLEAQHVVRIERGRGTFVNPIRKWSSMEAVVRATSRGEKDADSSIKLIELRRMLETGAADLAATRISPEEIRMLHGHLASMRAAHQANDVGGFVEADLAFHDTILHASGNFYLAVLLEPLSRVMAERRVQTSRIPEIQAHAIKEHAGIIKALKSGDPAIARRAMDSHMTQTLADLKQYVLHP